jgi:hypothetical protein
MHIVKKACIVNSSLFLFFRFSHHDVAFSIFKGKFEKVTKYNEEEG